MTATTVTRATLMTRCGMRGMVGLLAVVASLSPLPVGGEGRKLVSAHQLLRFGAFLTVADILLELGAELTDRLLDRPAGAVGQPADRRTGHDADGVADLLQYLQVLRAPLSAAQAVGHLQHPAGAFPARRTLAARFMSEEPADVVQHIDDAGRLVEDRDGGGPEAEAAGLAGAVEVERRIELRLGHHAHADPTGDAALRLAPLPDAAAVPVHQLADGHAQRELDTAGLVHVSADAVQLRAEAAGVARVLGVGRHAHRLEPLHPAVDDMRDARHRLDVVDDGRLAERPLDGWERRLDARPGPFAFQALDQTGFLAADVGAGAAVQVDVE